MHLVDLPASYPPHTGGVEKYAHELHSALLDADPDLRITVLTSDLGAEAGTERISERWTVVRWPSREPATQYPVPTLGFWRSLCAHCGPDSIVMTHTRFYAHVAIAGWFARSHGLGWVHVEHGSSSVRSGNSLVRSLAKLVDATFGKRVLRNADAAVAVSGAASRFAFSLARREPKVLYRGINIPEQRANGPRAELPVVCFVGRLLNGKGVADLLRATRYLKERGIDLRLRLCGDGPAHRELVELTESHGLSDRVDFLGAVSHETALQEMSAATLFVHPSWTEGLPTTVLEAAALGCAVVATDVGGTSEIITHERSGWLVESRDPESLTAGMEAALADGHRRATLATTLREETRLRFDWRNTVRGFHEIFTELTDPNHETVDTQ